jgi:ABC-type branched-subunit amino acid transport system substrate-binding protein
VKGQPIELVIGDSGTDAGTAVAEAMRLIADEGVSAIVGRRRAA